MVSQSTIVQAEFYHTDSRLPLKAQLQDCIERAIDGSNVKTVMRFYDFGAVVTKIIANLCEAERKKAALQAAFLRAGCVRQYVLDWQIWYQSVKIQTLQEMGKEYAIRLIRDAFDAGEQVVIERSDSSFRPVHRNEQHELLEAAAASYDAVLSVYEPVDMPASADVALFRAM